MVRIVFTDDRISLPIVVRRPDLWRACQYTFMVAHPERPVAAIILLWDCRWHQWRNGHTNNIVSVDVVRKIFRRAGK